jgi:transcriptional regulator with XRE-family HTH domain
MGMTYVKQEKRHQRAIDWKAVGERLKALRGGITQAQFAKQIGASQGYVSHLERGEKEIGPEILLRISQLSDRSMEWILTGHERVSRK